MPIRVNLPGGAVANFPDGTPPAEIERELSQPSRPATPPPPGATIGMLAQSTAQGDPKSPGTAFGRQMRPDIQAAMDQSEADGSTFGQSPFLGNPLALVGAAKKVPGIVAKGLGISKVRAGANMQSALEAAKDVRVGMDKVVPGIERAKELVTAGSNRSQVIHKLEMAIKKSQDGSLSTREAQDFVSTASRMSSNEFGRLSPVMQRQVSEVASALRQSLTDAAGTVGKGEQYTAGVREYSRAAQAAKYAKKAAKAAAGAAGLGAAYSWID